MDFLVETTIRVPDGVADDEVERLGAEEARRAAELAADGFLLRIWRPADRGSEWKNIGVWSADNAPALRAALDSLPLRPWMTFDIRELEPHPNDPGETSR